MRTVLSFATRIEHDNRAKQGERRRILSLHEFILVRREINRAHARLVLERAFKRNFPLVSNICNAYVGEMCIR